MLREHFYRFIQVKNTFSRFLCKAIYKSLCGQLNSAEYFRGRIRDCEEAAGNMIMKLFVYTETEKIEVKAALLWFMNQ